MLNKFGVREVCLDNRQVYATRIQKLRTAETDKSPRHANMREWDSHGLITKQIKNKEQQ